MMKQLQQKLMEIIENQSAELVSSLIVVIVTCIICLVFLLIWILINRNKIHVRQIETDRMLQHFETLLFDYLTSEHKHEIYVQIAKVAMSGFNRKILFRQMRELSRSLHMSAGLNNEEACELLKDLYYRLRLDRDSIRKIYSSKWHIQVKGFRELAFMDVTDANDKLRKALKSKNNIIRSEAQVALIRLNRDDPFGFLDHQTHPFTLWEQLSAYELMELHNLPVPDFSRWTNSPNKTVVIFALRMIQVFKQQHAVSHVIDCLKHPDKEIRHIAIIVCGEVQLRESLPYLKQMYKDEDDTLCLSIIQAIGKMPDESMLTFLKLVLDKEDDVQLQIESAKAINKMGEEGIAALVKLMKSEYKNYQIIIRHVLDKRIN